jgi:8-oxo-dGTP pyrophosphatase MutT (NUDIX family)
MREAEHLVANGNEKPFSPEGFRHRALERGLDLDKASWMAAQPPSYGIDAGRRMNADGTLNELLRLDQLIPAESWRLAAVLVPVIARKPEASVLLTLRTTELSSHGGQISFPGGKVEAADPTPVATALREAWEEVGMPPSLVTPLSLLDLHNTGTGFRIIPVLALVEPAFVPTPYPGEVQEVFEVPLSFLMTEKNHIHESRDYKGTRVLFYAMQWQARYIWGATAAIVRNLYDRLYAPDMG